MTLYPLLFTPVLKQYVWGGRTLQTLLGRPLPPGNVAESWEIAAHEDGASVVANGRFAGLSLPELHTQLGLALIGTNNQWAQARGKFPLLVKLLDAHASLSVQVHPTDEYAQAYEGNELGKTEMWVVLHAAPEAAVILGVRAGTTPEAFRRALQAGQAEPLLHRLPIKAGDFVCVPSGSLHAILGGALIAEIQQNSNTTYRVYDWNRLDNGKPRPLHIDKALDVINFAQVEPSLPHPTLLEETAVMRRSQLCANRYFVTERVEMAAGAIFSGECDGRSLEIWGCLSGEIEVNGVPVTAVGFTLLPAAMGPFAICTTQPATLLRVTTP